MKKFLQSTENKYFDKIVNNLGNNEKIVKDILNLINNYKTKVVFDKDIKSSYYVFFNDTIYIADNEKNNSYYRVCLLAHECIHSLQSKTLQILNFLFSNLELILFCVCLIFNIFVKYRFIFIINLIYFMINISNIAVRLVLEINAVNNSINLSEKYLEGKICKRDLECIIAQYKIDIKKLYPFFIISLFLNKIIRLLIIFLISYCKYN